jgi:hypothetical protein
MLNSNLGDSNHGDWARLEQGDTVPAGAPYISFWFSAVVEGVHFLAGDPYGSDAYVLAEILDSTGTPIYSTRFSWYDNASQLVDDGCPNTGGPWKHLPWTQYFWDMSAYIGQSVTIRYTAYDCAYSGHQCWGFIDDAQWLTASQVPTYTPTPSSTPTMTQTPTVTDTPTPTPSFTTTFTPTNTPTPTATSTATTTPTFTPTCVPEVWPDPFNPKYAKDNVLKIGCVTPGSKVSIYTLSGEKIWETSQSAFLYGGPFTAVWDGRKQNGVPVSPGVYYYVIQDGIHVLQRGKFLVTGGP